MNSQVFELKSQNVHPSLVYGPPPTTRGPDMAYSTHAAGDLTTAGFQDPSTGFLMNSEYDEYVPLDWFLPGGGLFR
ncbi:hypothetical protein DUNSADRAFT_2376 [Dunaliella salina]|uniref:Encoded protein n=1 Tax=Dunaliella salina TaxID=3046 RepID=A0ABQ7GVP4_DUNSA|nr:hypothetical protein DUNSADRAFT_2376 [Dunaliella salina]|eukprot:KAF5838681.1 hypothetical protein DUNSADRAFT_2376 [Dunaliella salina]